MICNKLRRLQLDLIYCYKLVFGLVKLNTGDFLSSVRFLILEGMHINCINLDVVKSEYISFLVELLMCGTVYLTLLASRVCDLLSTP